MKVSIFKRDVNLDKIGQIEWMTGQGDKDIEARDDDEARDNLDYRRN